MSVDPGFNPHSVLSMVVSVAGTNEEQSDRRANFYRELLDKVRALPGVQAAGAINHLPLAGDLWDRGFRIEGRPEPRPGESPDAVYRIVMPGYFETMRLPLRSGRLVSGRDNAGSPNVVILNERAARQYWPGESPVGKRIAIGDNTDGSPNWFNVIGVVANARQIDWAYDPDPEMYLAALQSPLFLGTGTDGIAAHMTYITLVVRSDEAPGELASAVRRTVWSFDRNLPVSQVITMDEAVADATAQARFEMLLLGLFGAVALFLAAVGIYGVMNYSVARRTREIAIRVSLGASRRDVLGMLVRTAMLQALAGTAGGVAGALLLSKLMAKMVFGVRPTDPVTFAGGIVLLSVAAMVATFVPARRAARIEPMKALRSD